MKINEMKNESGFKGSVLKRMKFNTLKESDIAKFSNDVKEFLKAELKDYKELRFYNETALEPKCDKTGQEVYNELDLENLLECIGHNILKVHQELISVNEEYRNMLVIELNISSMCNINEVRNSIKISAYKMQTSLATGNGLFNYELYDMDFEKQTENLKKQFAPTDNVNLRLDNSYELSPLYRNIEGLIAYEKLNNIEI